MKNIWNGAENGRYKLLPLPVFFCNAPQFSFSGYDECKQSEMLMHKLRAQSSKPFKELDMTQEYRTAPIIQSTSKDTINYS